MTEKPKLDDLILAIDDLNSIYYDEFRASDRRYLKSRKDYLLPKCNIIKNIISAYLEEAPSLHGYLTTIDYIESQLRLA